MEGFSKAHGFKSTIHFFLFGTASSRPQNAFFNQFKSAKALLLLQP